MADFNLLWKRNVPHILTKIFLHLAPDDVTSCQLVCKAWQDFIKEEILAKPGLVSTLILNGHRRVWMETPVQRTIIPCYDKRDGSVRCYAYRGVYYSFEFGEIRELALGKGPIEDRAIGLGEKDGYVIRKEGEMLFTDRYSIIANDGDDALVFSRETLERLCCIDLKMVWESIKGRKTLREKGGDSDSEDEEEELDVDEAYEVMYSHITAVHVVGNDVYVLAQIAEKDGEDLDLKLFQLSEEDGTFSLDQICDLPFDFEEVYNIHNVYAGGSPLEAFMNKDRVLVVGCNDKELLYDYHKGESVRERELTSESDDDSDDESDDDKEEDMSKVVGGYVVFQDTFYGYASKKGIFLFDLSTGKRLLHLEEGLDKENRRLPLSGKNSFAVFSRQNESCDMYKLAGGKFSKTGSIPGNFATGAIIGNGDFVVLLDMNGSVQVWDLQTNTSRELMKLAIKITEKTNPRELQYLLSKVGPSGLFVREADKNGVLITFDKDMVNTRKRKSRADTQNNSSKRKC